MYSRLIDCSQEMIKVNGLQVAPADLEAVLLEHPDIVDAAVVGMTLGDEEFPRAYIVLKDGVKHQTEQSIQAWVAKRVAKHKQLRGGVVFIDEVPKLASGKIQRKVMREWARRDAAATKRGGKSLL
jgi:acyl-coenzyme A synthetase/AMP-(fatty) acid ligase